VLRTAPQVSITTAAADAALAPVAVPSCENRGKLWGRRMSANPLEAWQLQLEGWAQQANVWVAARVDAHPLLSVAALVAATFVITTVSGDAPPAPSFPHPPLQIPHSSGACATSVRCRP
jgi:hypothetical protein